MSIGIRVKQTTVILDHLSTDFQKMSFCYPGGSRRIEIEDLSEILNWNELKKRAEEGKFRTGDVAKIVTSETSNISGITGTVTIRTFK